MTKRKRDITLDGLHEQGFVLLPSFIDVPENVKEGIGRQSKRARAIFGPDRKRRQCSLYTSAKYMKRFTNLLDHQIKEIISSERVKSNWIVLHSKKGCRRQQAHTDYEPTGGILEVPNEDIPLAAVLALEDNTKLVVWPGSIGFDFTDFKENDGIELVFNAGDLVVFRGDLVHAGAAYQEENIRLHCYLDHKDVDRKNNRTLLVKETYN